MTKRFGVLAYPAAHSLSPAMFNAAFKALGIDAKYEIFEVRPESFEKFISDVKRWKIEISGLSVSLPYKEKILPFLNEVSEDAKKIGAVNTVTVRRENNTGDVKLFGDNTDFVGAVEALKESSLSVDGLKDKKILVLGAGGASRAIVYGLIKSGAEVTILNRTKEKAKELSGNFGCGYDELSSILKYKPEVLVQATSALLTEGISARIVPEGYFEKLASNGCKPVAMDIVYKPSMTPLLTDAKNAGCEIITGDKMLLLQAAKQFEIWTGERAPVEVMKVAISK